MYKKGSKPGTIHFSVKPKNGARKVELAACFNGWKPLAMARQKDGSFVRVVDMPAGICEYKFIIDGQWQHDLDHSAWAINPHGTLNSVAQI